MDVPYRQPPATLRLAAGFAWALGMAAVAGGFWAMGAASFMSCEGQMYCARTGWAYLGIAMTGLGAGILVAAWRLSYSRGAVAALAALDGLGAAAALAGAARAEEAHEVAALLALAGMLGLHVAALLAPATRRWLRPRAPGLLDLDDGPI